MGQIANLTDRYNCHRDQNQQQNSTVIIILLLYHYFQVTFYWGKKHKISEYNGMTVTKGGENYVCLDSPK